MKEDAPPPKHPPRKRYQLEKAPDFWLAVWANDEELPGKERERAQDVRDARKAAIPDRKVGVLIDREGVNPVQLEALAVQLQSARPTEIHHPWASPAVHTVCRRVGMPVKVHKDVRSKSNELRDVVLASMLVIVAPRGTKNQTPAWEAMKYAKHRSLEVVVILPDGTTERR